MKIRVWIINSMNQVREKKIDLKNPTFELGNNTYRVESPYVITKGNKKYIIYSKGIVNSALNPDRNSAEQFLQKQEEIVLDKSNTVQNESTVYDTQFQILLHTNGLRTFLGTQKDSFALTMMIGIAGFVFGLILMAVLGHVRF